MSGHVLRRNLGNAALWTGSAAVVAFFAFPIVYLVSVSFKTKDDSLSGDFFPTTPILDNWPNAFQSAAMATFIGNSVLTSALSGILTIAITLPASYAMLRLGIGRRWLPQATLSSYLAPPIVAMVPLFYFLKHTGLLNSLAGLTIAYGCINIPVAFWLLAPFLRRIPLDIEHAAAIDGADTVRIFLQIVLPLVAPGIAATTIIVIILSYNEFLLASAFTFADATRTLTVGISLFQGDRLVNFGQMAAASLTGIAPVYLIALFMQRYLIEGLTHGGVKS
jgi:multiple sugar transport system permease protein